MSSTDIIQGSLLKQDLPCVTQQEKPPFIDFWWPVITQFCDILQLKWKTDMLLKIKDI